MNNLKPGDRGIALILVLWVLALLSVLVMEFCFTMRTETNITRNFKEGSQLSFYAQGGIHRAVAELIYRSDPAIHNRRQNIQNIQNMKTEGSATMEEEWRVDGTPYPVSFRNGEAEVKVRSESGRISLNGAQDALLRKVMKYFVEAGEQRDVIIDSILDWKDPDDLHRLNGAENDYYRSLPEPYDCKNAAFDTVEEMMLVRGVTPELFFGRRGKEAKEGEAQGSPAIGFRDVFTVFSTATNVDMNSAPLEVIIALFGIPQETAKKVVESRQEQPFKNLEDLRLRVPELVPFLPEVQTFVGFVTTTPYFNITSLAKLKTGESKRRLECVVKIDAQEKSGYRVVMWRDISL
jgi:general secretion pathway protein K